MSLAANKVVKARCPGCKKSLKIPASWVGQSMRCKHCALVFQAQAVRKRRIVDGVKRATRLVVDALRKRRRRRKKKKDGAVVAKPFTPPPAIPIGPTGAAPGAPPAAIPVVASAKAFPAAIPVGPGANGAPPAAIPAAIPTKIAFELPPETGAPRRRSRGGLQKLAFVVIFCVAVGGMASIIYTVSNNQGPDNSWQALVDTSQASDPELVGPGTGPAKNTEATKPGPKNTAQAPPVSVKGPDPKPTGIAKATEKARPTEVVKTTDKGPAIGPNTTRNTGRIDVPVAGREQFPRRMLAVISANYPYNPPVTYGTNNHSLTNILKMFGDIMKIPEEQVVILSDRAPTPKPPTRAIIELNVSEFLKSCRPQDRIVLLFVGHAADAGGKPCLMPLEGERDDEKTLIPLEWLFQKLAMCPARQKVLMLDVCRYDPAQGEERGMVSKMSEAFDDALKTPPPGVQVLTACTAGQFSYESRGINDIEGGVMLGLIPDLKFKGGIKGVIQRPEDPIPIEEFTSLVKFKTNGFAKAFLKAEQTPRLSGSAEDGKLAYDPKVPPAKRFDLQLAGNFKNGAASGEDIRAMLSITTDIPPPRKSDTNSQINFNAMPPYPVEALAAYKDDGKMTPFRAKIVEAIGELKSNDASFQDVFIAPPNNPQVQNQFKTGLEAIQKRAGLLQFKLDTALEELDDMKDMRKEETKRWQANYDYVRARLSARIAYVLEYNAKLGEMRKDFPARDPNLHDGWRLVPKAKLSDRDAEKYAKKATQYLETIAKEHTGTPWEMVAKREKFSSLGLDWAPKSNGKAPAGAAADQ